MNGMTKTEAIAFINQIEQICKEKGIWFSLTQDHRPYLGKVKVEISVKINPTEDNLKKAVYNEFGICTKGKISETLKI